MIRRLIILVSIISFTLYSCQQDDFDNTSPDPSVSNDKVPVNFSLSLDLSTYNETGYEPMRSSKSTQIDDTVKLMVTNIIRGVIAKKIDNKWILEDIVDVRFDPNAWNDRIYYEIKSTTPIPKISTVLTPGEYRMTIFTGVASVKWEEEKFKKGMVLGLVDGTEGYTNNDQYPAERACTYIKEGSKSYMMYDNFYIGEEIFTGSKYFVVEKTKDLHSSPAAEISIPLSRRVSRLRVALKNEKSPANITFVTGIAQGILATIEAQDGTYFCSGLDVWGNAYHKDGLTSMKYGGFTCHMPNPDNLYYIGVRGNREYAALYFSEPGHTTKLKITYISVTAQGGTPTGAYNDAINSPVLTMDYNTTVGLAYKPGYDRWQQPNPYAPDQMDDYFEIVLDTKSNGDPVDPNELFHNYYEYTNRE